MPLCRRFRPAHRLNISEIEKYKLYFYAVALQKEQKGQPVGVLVEAGDQSLFSVG
jgi:hypothetical protein